MGDCAQFLRTAGARIHFRSAGSGPALVFVHGWALDLGMWAPQFACLRDRFRVIAFDRRGFGLSSGSPGVEEDVLDLRFLLDALDVQRAAIVGMSQGARVALRCALSFPERIGWMALDGPPHEGSPTGEAADEVPMAHYRELYARAGIEAVRQAWMEHPLLRLCTSDAGMHALLRSLVARYPGHDLRASPSTAPSIARALGAIRVPALVINGAEDSAARHAAGAELTRLLPDARRALVPAAGHLPNLDNPVAYCELLSEFADSGMAISQG